MMKIVTGAALIAAASAFAPQARRAPARAFAGRAGPRMSMLDAGMASVESLSALSDLSAALPEASLPSLTTAFADQADNAAGPLFAGSLFPYLAFLGFLGYEKNGLPKLAGFGYAFLLLFVIATIPSAIVAKLAYGVSLADSDWLHGTAEGLLTVTNLLAVTGLRGAFFGDTAEDPVSGGGKAARGGALAYAGLAVASFFVLSGKVDLGLPLLEAHSAFLGGVGDLPQSVVSSLNLAHAEPVNALSIPTWAIHFSSVIEYVVAMRLVWAFAGLSGNEAWKGLTWGMLPLHASGLVACTYHFFYNSPDIGFMVTLQAALTLLGDVTCAIAAYRIAASNGWTPKDLNPLRRDAEEESGAAYSFSPAEEVYEPPALAGEVAKLTAATIGGSYLVKYGSLAIDLPFEASAPAALAMVFLPPAVIAAQLVRSSPDLLAKAGLGGGDGEEAKGFSMEDVKKFGVAGTVSYVITELAFWAVAIPAASFVFYQTNDAHWPDFADNADRAKVLATVFAASNIARAALPLRLGAALAISPWVDRTFFSKEEETAEE